MSLASPTHFRGQNERVMPYYKAVLSFLGVSGTDFK
jgi:hypothetical protein